MNWAAITTTAKTNNYNNVLLIHFSLHYEWASHFICTESANRKLCYNRKLSCSPHLPLNEVIRVSYYHILIHFDKTDCRQEHYSYMIYVFLEAYTLQISKIDVHLGELLHYKIYLIATKVPVWACFVPEEKDKPSRHLVMADNCHTASLIYTFHILSSFLFNYRCNLRKTI